MLSAAIACLVMIATVLQYRDAVEAINRERPHEATVFRVVDDWRHEVPWWRIFAWWRHRKSVRQVLAESPEEAAVYRRLFSLVLSWTLLTAAAGLGLLSVIISQLRSLV